MPSTTIHLMIAHEIEPNASGLFLLGNKPFDFGDEKREHYWKHDKKVII